MEVLEAIIHRRSVRTYQSLIINSNDLTSLLDCARMAPSGSNTQPWRFIVVRNEELRARIAEICEQEWMLQAPVFIVCVADIRTRIKDGSPIFLDEKNPELDLKRVIRDTTIAIEHIVLQAESIGLATCWVGHFEQRTIRPALGIPDDKYVVAVITIGYAADTPEAKPRYALSDIVFWEKWEGINDPAFMLI